MLCSSLYRPLCARFIESVMPTIGSKAMKPRFGDVRDGPGERTLGAARSRPAPVAPGLTAGRAASAAAAAAALAGFGEYSTTER